MTTADPRHDDPPPTTPGCATWLTESWTPTATSSCAYLVLGTSERDGRAGVGGGARPFAPDELSGDAGLRLYRATVETAQVHVRGSHPVWGSGIDRRVTVRLG